MNIKCTQNIYKSANGVSNVTYYILVPEGVEVRGIVQLSHGMCEYFSRYTAFAKYLCGLGFIVCGNDHIGHGASVSRTADLGFFAARDGWKYLVANHADKLNSIAPINAEAPAVPWPTVFTGMIFLSLQSWCTNQAYVQRVLAAKNLKEAQKGALLCATLKIIGFMYLALPGVIAYALFQLNGTEITMMDDAYPTMIMQVVPAPLMGFFAAVMFGAILSSFNSFLNSINTMFTLDIYKEFIKPEANELQMVKIGKKVGIAFAVLTTIIGPMVYFFPGGLRTFLDSLVMLVALPVLSAVFGGFFFKYLPKFTAKFIMIFHIVFYGAFLLISPSYSLFGGSDGTIHYLYAVLVLWPIEMIIMALLNSNNKKKHPELAAWVQKDAGAVDLTPWKYRGIASVAILLFVAVVYLAFSPLGVGTWAYSQPF